MTKSKPTTEIKAPAFIAWNITSKGESVFWNRMGAAWTHKDGKGLSLRLDMLPVDGRIVLREPTKPAPAGEQQ